MSEMNYDILSTPFIRDLYKGLLEEAHFLVRKIILNTGKKNKPFLRIIMADKTGHLPAIYFGPVSELKEVTAKIKPGDIVKISGIVEDFQGVTQLKLMKIEPDTKPDWDLSRFWKRTPLNRRELYKEIKDLIEQITELSLKKLCMTFLKDRAFMKLFLEAPASRTVHHAYIGGLLEHTLNVMKLCLSYAQVYPQADKNLLLTGSFLHDIGKVDEYEFLLSQFDHSESGRLKGHTILGYERLMRALQTNALEPNLRMKVEHMVLAHQGKRIWGAAEEPRFLESFLIHAADSTDASQFIFSEPKRLNRGNDSAWSEYNTYLGREIYLR